MSIDTDPGPRSSLPATSEEAWNDLVASAAPVAVAAPGRPGRPRMTEADVPAPIRSLVERALEEGTYFELRLPLHALGEFAKLVRRYARVRSAGRLSVGGFSSTPDGDQFKLRFRVRRFTPRASGESPTKASPEMVAQAAPAPGEGL